MEKYAITCTCKREDIKFHNVKAEEKEIKVIKTAEGYLICGICGMRKITKVDPKDLDEIR